MPDTSGTTNREFPLSRISADPFFSVFLGRVYKKKNEKDFFLVFGVGVDGFEPPTLCL